MEETRYALEQWVETQRVISKEKRDLALSKEMLNQRIALVEREIGSLKERTAEAEESIAEAEGKRGELEAERERLREATASLEQVLLRLEAGLRDLLNWLPDPLLDRIKPLTQRLPDGQRETRLSLSERFQNVIGVLNEIDKFNREIAVVSEVRTVEDGSSQAVTTLYLGLGQAYYVGANGRLGGVGRPSAEGWVWEPANEHAGRIAEAIAIINNEQVAGYVQLPVAITEEAGTR